jgi:hypothetical protein
MTQTTSLEDNMEFWADHPDQFVRDVFEGVIPDAWQDETLKAFPYKQRLAMRASKGPGKTCVLAWIAWNFLLTRPNCRIAATSITGENLADGLWAEMAKWRNKSPLLQEMFEWTKTRIYRKDARYESTWFMAARTWSKSATAEDQGMTFAGFHEDFVMFILDESGGIPQSVMVNADAALSSCKEGHIIQAGNTVALEGPLYRACTAEKHLWHIVDINGDPENPNRSPRVSLKWANEMIGLYGRDHPYVKVSVLGQFPDSSFNSLIGVDEVEASMKRLYAEQDYINHPRILGVDVAREGVDESVVTPRQGLQMFKPMTFRNIDGTQGASHVARKWREWKADGCFIDGSGGFGSSWQDNLIRLGYAPISVHFSSKPVSERFFNKRTEMIFELVEWIKRGGALYPVKELVAELTQSTYTFKGDRLLLEPKELLKAKIGRSCDHLDSVALTFAAPVEKAPQFVDGWPIDSVRTPVTQRYGDYRPLSREYIQRGKKY